MNLKNLLDDKTICALSTPPGVSAISLIRLSGKDSVKIVDHCFSKAILDAEGYSVHYGAFKDNEDIVDDVIITVFRAPKSFTGEDIVEIACHGSTFIQQKIIEVLLQNGAAMAEPGEFSKRAFFNGKMDLSQTEAIADLIHSTSSAAHKIAVNQMRGGFSNDLKDLREKLIHFASMVELELDFSEEDIEFADRTELENLVEEVLAFVAKLANSFKLGNAIKNGVQTVIAGRPNAGKSTLLNGLLNEERALVSDIEGTTRDTIEEVMIINGIEFRLVDTAGIREAHDTVEKMGIERTMEKINQSALLIYVYDETKVHDFDVEADLKEIGFPRENTLLLANKTDMRRDNYTLPSGSIPISAKNTDDIERVKKALYELFIEDEAQLENTIVTNARHYDALMRAHADLEKVKHGLEVGISGDFLAIDIRQSLHHLGSILGEVSTDDLLGNIFANFCIGK